MAGRKTARDASSDDGADVTQPPVVPLTTTLLSSRIRRELQNTWNAARTTHEAGRRGDGNSVDGDNAVEVPAFKVGTLEMYRRFPRQYDLIMRRHDCSAVQDYLDGLLTTLQRSTTAATAETEAVKSATEGEGEGTREEHTSVSEKARVLHVADFGCGTGRIASMVSRHPSVGAVYCYDSETAMLRQCVCNVVRSVAVARPDTCGVRLLPAADSANNNNDNDDDDDDAAAKAVDDGAVYIGDERGANPAGGVVRLCARPASFTDVQRGFLAAHPPCQLVVCAWSLSYVMRAQWGADRWHAAVDATLERLIGLLDATGAAGLVIIETLGTDTTEPRRNNTLALRLEEHYGFERRWVRTDYNFRDTDEAARLTRFFFGEAMAQRMAVAARTTLPECTGIWTLWRK